MTTQKTATIGSVARELSIAFVAAERADGELFTRLKVGAPDWMTQAVFAAHDDGQRLPDDTLYDMCEKAADYIADALGPDGDDEDEAREAYDSVEPPIWNQDLTAWLASHTGNLDVVDEACEEWGDEPMPMFRRLSLGWLYQFRNVAEAVLSVVIEQRDDRNA